eukprot:TRINITY_DN47180_c0_g1_i1.p1 TRINITY_DN47180_c0_g1~~TRINITY_DN47180_c0_g1_i1.p1  ORF type:complete len:1719 (+),score=476.55 TRINITY_DN47180_c0_g1_i1:72-5159(+)
MAAGAPLRPLIAGDRVRRNPDWWRYGADDGGIGGEGTVSSVDHRLGVCDVRWHASGRVGQYRWGRGDAWDITPVAQPRDNPSAGAPTQRVVSPSRPPASPRIPDPAPAPQHGCGAGPAADPHAVALSGARGPRRTPPSGTGDDTAFWAHAHEHGGGALPPPGDGAGCAKLLLISVSYGDDPALFLPGAAGELRAVQQLLSRRGFVPPQRRVLTEGSESPPTRDGIMSALRWLVRGSVAGDALYLHVVARGLRSLPDLGEDPGEGDALAPCDWRDAGLVRDDELWDVLVGGLAPGARLTCVFDVFRAGASLLSLPFHLTAASDGALTLTETPTEPIPGQVVSVGLAPGAAPRTGVEAAAAQSGPSGALSSAFVSALVARPRPTHEQLALDLRSVLRQRLGERAPGVVVSASQRFDLRAPFSLQAVPQEIGPPAGGGEAEHLALLRRVEMLEDELDRQRSGRGPAQRRSGGRGAPRRASQLEPPDEIVGAARAVIVGIDYKDCPQEPARLTSCPNKPSDEARLVQQRLMEQGFNARVQLLTDDAAAERLRPTRDNLLAALRWLTRDAVAGEALYFHFIGHGAAAGQGGDGSTVALAPLDFSRRGFITGDEVRSVLISPLPAGCRLICVADLAAAGTVSELPHVISSVPGAGLSFSHSALDAGSIPAAVAILSCLPGEADGVGEDGPPPRPSCCLSRALATVLDMDPQPLLGALLGDLGEQLRQQLGDGCRAPCLATSWRCSEGDVFHLGTAPQRLRRRKQREQPTSGISPERPRPESAAGRGARPAQGGPAADPKSPAGAYDGGAARVKVSGAEATVSRGDIWKDAIKKALIDGNTLRFEDEEVGTATYDPGKETLHFPQLGSGGSTWAKDKAPPGGKGGEAEHATVAAYPQPPPRPVPVVVGASRALVIGIDYAGQECALQGCARDTQTVQRFLQRQGFHAELRCLTDDNPAQLPVRANILACLRWLSRGCVPGDSLFLHFIGHGGRHPGREQGRQQELDVPALCPLDWASAGVIGAGELGEVLLGTLPPGTRLTCVFDLDHPCPTPICDLAHSLAAAHDGGFEMRECPGQPHPAHVVSITAAPPPPPRPPGATVGALTTAFMTVLNQTPQPRYEQLVSGLGAVLRQRCGEGAPTPRLSSSRRVAPDSEFGLGTLLDPGLSQGAPQVSSPPPLILLGPQGAEPLSPPGGIVTGASKALVVGATYQRQGGRELPQSGGEARGVVALLERAGFGHGVKLLTEDNPLALPTRANIVQSMRWLVAGAEPGDALVFAFVGHGARVLEADPGDPGPPAIAPSDWAKAGIINRDEICEVLLHGLSSGVHLTALFDIAAPSEPIALRHSLTAEADGAFTLTHGRGGQAAGDAVFLALLPDPRQPPPPPAAGPKACGALSAAVCTVLGRHPQPTCAQLLSDIRQQVAQRTGTPALVPRLSSSNPFAPADRFCLGALPAAAPPPNWGAGRDWGAAGSPPPGWRGPSAIRDDGSLIDPSPRRLHAQRAPSTEPRHALHPQMSPRPLQPPYGGAGGGGQGFYDPRKMAELTAAVREIQDSIHDALSEVRGRGGGGELSARRSAERSAPTLQRGTPSPPRHAAVSPPPPPQPLASPLPPGAAPRLVTLRYPSEPLGMRLVPSQGGGAVLVESVAAASPAEAAGICAGDVVHAIGGFPVRSSDDVRAARGLTSRQGLANVFIDVTPAALA